MSLVPNSERPWMTLRVCQVLLTVVVALWVTLVAVGNVTDYGTNFAFVQHVLLMDSVFATSSIVYRALAQPWIHHAAYGVIIACEVVVAFLCWWGAWRLWRNRRVPAAEFRQAKGMAVTGLTLAIVLWLGGFMVVGGEWFGMWMSSQWNGIPSAFRFVVVSALVLLVLITRDD